uniref:Uncharacterized protein n=1 Tax=Panagrolaimus sp. JU765 TaxID=591449 RepID=A0AC34RQ93_9BILA
MRMDTKRLQRLYQEYYEQRHKHDLLGTLDLDLFCRYFSQLCATDQQQNNYIMKKLLSGAEVVGGVQWKYLSKSYFLLMQSLKLNHFPFRCPKDDDTHDEVEKIKEEIENYFDCYPGASFTIINGQKHFYLASESTSEEVQNNYTGFIDECQQPIDESSIEDYLE